MNPGSHTYREITSQGTSWAATLDAVGDAPETLAAWLRRPAPETLFTGCGSTYYLSLAAAAVWQEVTGQRARAIPASEIWLLPDAALPHPLPRLVAVSRSGETTETLRAVETYRARGGGDWLAVTCYGESALGQAAPLALVAQQATEESIAQTRSFSTMFLLSLWLAAFTAGRRADLDDLRRLPEQVDRWLRQGEGLMQQLAADRRFDHFVFLGSGPCYGLACEAMLKMKEMSLSTSEAFHCMEYRHGPKSVAGNRTLVIGLINEAAQAQEAAVLAEIRSLGATTLAIAESAAGMVADHRIELRSGLGALARAALKLPLLQLLAYHRAMAKGLNPDRPLNLDAVVRL